MRKFAHLQVGRLLRALAVQLNKTAEAADAEAIHDLRVAVRRLSRALRTFAQFFPGKSWRRIRKDLSDLMDRTGAVRDCDIAAELMNKAGVTKRARAMLAVQKRRREAEAELLEELQEWQARKFAREWRGALEL